MDQLLTWLRAAAEPTRLRILQLCAHGELTVSELTDVLGQSQPRVSRHLKLLSDAGLLERHRDGAWVFYRPARAPEISAFAAQMLSHVPEDSPVRWRDLSRLSDLRAERAQAAADYFSRNAHHWDAISALRCDEAEVERALVSQAASRFGRDSTLLDIATGTGRVLELLAGHVGWATGVDISREMLDVARDRLGRKGIVNCSLRQTDMYRLPLELSDFDLITLHQVLHYSDDPEGLVVRAARLLRPGGRLLICDLDRHTREDLREVHAHRRLGFTTAEVSRWLARAGLSSAEPLSLPGDSITVMFWAGDAKPVPSGLLIPDTNKEHVTP